MEDYKEKTLIEIVRKSKHNKNIMDKYFNPTNKCLGCLIISDLTLKEACKLKEVDLNTVISQLI